MSLNQTNKMAWLVETIRKAGPINFEEINQRWIDNEDMSRGKPLFNHQRSNSWHFLTMQG